MSNEETIPVTVRILEKEYKISCPQGEHESLLLSAKNVNDNMLKVRKSGKALSADRVAVMAAINIAHELVKLSQKNNVDNSILSKINDLQESIERVL